MGNAQKLQQRFLSRPTDFTWEELMKVLGTYGYTPLKKGKTGGSRRKFIHANNDIINLHKPHPANVLKAYIIKQIIEHFKENKNIEKL